MGLSVNVKLNVPALPATGVWFANNLAWQNYWSNIEVQAEFNPANNTKYVAVPYNNALEPAILEISGVQYRLIQEAQFTSLMSRLDALDNNYQTMRTELKTLGLLANSQ